MMRGCSLELLREIVFKIKMPTLLLTPRHTEDSQELWRACVRSGWKVERVHGWKVPEVNPRDAVIYAEPLLAAHIANTLGVELIEPPIDWLPTLPERWRKRSVQLTTMKNALLRQAHQKANSSRD